MQPLGEGLRQTVGQRLDHDRRVVVVGVLEAVCDLVLADAGRDDEGADVIAVSLRRDEIGQRDVGPALAAGQLLAQGVQRGERLAAIGVGEHLDVVARTNAPARSPRTAAALNQPLSTISFSIFCASA